MFAGTPPNSWPRTPHSVPVGKPNEWPQPAMTTDAVNQSAALADRGIGRSGGEREDCRRIDDDAEGRTPPADSSPGTSSANCGISGQTAT